MFLNDILMQVCHVHWQQAPSNILFCYVFSPIGPFRNIIPSDLYIWTYIYMHIYVSVCMHIRLWYVYMTSRFYTLLGTWYLHLLVWLALLNIIIISSINFSANAMALSLIIPEYLFFKWEPAIENLWNFKEFLELERDFGYYREVLDLEKDWVSKETKDLKTVGLWSYLCFILKYWYWHAILETSENVLVV